MRSVAWSPDGTKIAAGGDFKKVIVFSSSGEKLWESPDLGDYILSVAWSPDGTKIAVGGAFGKVIVFSHGLGGLCDVVSRALVSGIGVSEVVGGSGVCGILGGWVLGDCGDVSGVSGVVGDAIEFLCRGDVGGVLAVLGFALDSGYWDNELFEVVRALTLGWGGRLLEFDSIVSGVGRAVGVDAPSVFDWLIDLLESGRPILSIAEEVREVVRWVLENAGGLREAASDGRFAAFVRGARYGGLRGFVEVLREGLSFLRSPSKYFRVRVGFEGSFTAGSFSEGVARVCNDSVTQVAVTSVSFSGVEGSVLSGVPLVLRPRECGEVGVSLRVPTPGRVPVEVSVSGEVAGVSVSSVVRAVVDASPSPAPSPSLGAGVRGRVPEAPPYLSPHYLVGKVLSLSFSPPSLKPLRVRGVVVGGLELRAVIGFGGFAVTLLGVDEVGRSFAVKLPRDAYESIVHGLTYAINRRRLAVFEREFKVLKGLNHPHLTKLVGGGVDSGVPYLVMEFCGNGSLRGVLESGSRVGLADALLIGVQVADALAYLHSRGIAHRDLKPENILFTEEGLLKVTDFNVAKVMGAVTTTSSRVAYTPGYAAPEQVMWGLGRSGPWTDVWSLGVVLYEAITGEPPFEPGDYEESIKEGPDLSPLPEEVRPIIKAMLTVEPGKRPPAIKVRDELAKLLYSISK